jgi:carboxyl-terminal processing protease
MGGNPMGHLKRYIGLFLTSWLILSTTPASAAEPIDEVRELIQEYYVEDLPSSVLFQPTIKEITQQLDPYSVFMTSAEFKEFTNVLEQELVGIGVVLEEDAKGIKIVSVLPGGPAERAGLLSGDIITHVDGSSVVGESVQQAITLISGQEGTSLSITLLRPDTGEIHTKSLTREVINLPNVEYAMLGGQIGYVKLYSFGQDSAEEMAGAIRKLEGAKGWIVDLRDNGGGYVSAAQEVSGLFPSVTKAFQLRDRSNKPYVYQVIPQSAKFTTPTHLLINGYSASASEMVSASVKEQKGATLYGQTSFGKGSMQTLFPLSDGSLLKLTTAHFFSPSGVPIHQLGVTPNIVTSEGEELIASHKDQLIASIPRYKQLPLLKNVPATKTFTVKMNMKMNWSGASSKDIQLIQLGGTDVPVTFHVKDEHTIEVKPNEPLQSKGTYVLIVHPNWFAENTKQMRNGIYLEVTVQ